MCQSELGLCPPGTSLCESGKGSNRLVFELHPKTPAGRRPPKPWASAQGSELPELAIPC